ncbi:MarR family winged helix-turn-helix transcriptional regulator [Phytomonospora endophytica]|uniref:DNA-binding MarR family transcriptional regulator n=1 Tax=Phytomonospora endophytica TaxID=714109 RepID=A0A841FZ48_9ACTN|nr:MarR family winged helix-turn-helix transcriptional regulator [Phytomonospora endophytica]MBB6040013.1 DNA-binding MarR family transcriptional regulator [Phytomonospora endophytica]
MVDDRMVNQVDDIRKGESRPGHELPVLLFAGFRTIIDRVHADLAEQGHPDARPAHGFALQAIGRGASQTEVARRLGISKQAAGKTVERLVALGYAERAGDVADARRKVVRLTERGADVLARSAEAFDRLRAEWSAVLGEERLRALEDDLRAVAEPGGFRLDAAGWIGGMG